MLADQFDDIDVGFFIPAADVVGLAHPACLQYAAYGVAMILDIEPVAYLQAIAVNRQRLACERIDDHERNQLFRKMVRAVVIGAVGGQCRQAVSVLIGPHQMVGGCLGSGIRAVGFVRMFFGESRSVSGQ
jgi:hypothetical protein